MVYKHAVVASFCIDAHRGEDAAKWVVGGCALNSHGDGAQWLSGRVLDSRLRGRRFKPHWRHCVMVLEQDTFIVA